LRNEIIMISSHTVEPVAPSAPGGPVGPAGPCNNITTDIENMGTRNINKYSYI
jgi:hypothetical protein